MVEGREAGARRPAHARQGALAIEDFFAALLRGRAARAAARCCAAPGHSFSDVAQKVVSIINLASVAAVENAVGAAVDPLALSRQSLCRAAGRPGTNSICSAPRSPSAARGCKVVKRIARCAATNVDPDTGIRDLTIPTDLLQTFGHADCGVYAEVVAAGEIAAGDALAVVT